VYHIELREGVNNYNHFNVDAPELGAIVETWVRDKPVDLGERRWSPYQAKLKILEGPHLPIESLSMGRGWRTAERKSEDVTERIFAEARQALAASPPGPGGAVPVAATPSLGLEDPLALGVALASLLGEDPAGLLAAWRQVAARSTGLSPSESLALAERDIGAASDGASL
jgi:hypothetical protein